MLKREDHLIKVNVSGGENTMGDGIIAAVALSVRWVAEKDAGDGAGCKLMRRSSGDARVAKAAEDAKPIIRGGAPKRR